MRFPLGPYLRSCICMHNPREDWLSSSLLVHAKDALIIPSSSIQSFLSPDKCFLDRPTHFPDSDGCFLSLPA